MADVISQPKRPRDEEISLEQEENSQDIIKRQKTYNQLLSILEEDEEEPINDNLSNIFTTLEQELSSSSDFSLNFDNILLPNFDVSEADQELHATNACFSLEKSMCNQILKNEKEEDNNNERYNDVMRHLLEASDDELGLPGTGGGAATEGGGGGGGDTIISVNDGLWEFEDESANYYAMLQSELFM
ncbi:hypothetical protein LIER_20680 [Lithospermum erythrorhizon]|uniref:Uncharacterized protein n=1 Tax=Lithospermum erythrorhizon TaxID=34254 RepID=A0AAV3QT10_LITER